MELIRVEDERAVLDISTELEIAEIEKQVKRLKDMEDNLKKSILAEMEDKGILKIDTPTLTISYIAPTDRETFQSKDFRADHPEMYDEYVKMTPVKSSVRIKVK